METKKNNKTHDGIDIRDISRFLLSKIWIIAVVSLCFAIAAFLYTNYGISRKYSSSTTLFILNDSSSGNSQGDWVVGQSLSGASPTIIKGDFCNLVAENLNANHKIDEQQTMTVMLSVLKGKISNEEYERAKSVGFVGYFGDVVGTKGISGSQIRGYISISADEDSPFVTVTATTPDPVLSAVVSNAVLYYYEDYVKTEIMGIPNDSTGLMDPNPNVKTEITSRGTIPGGPSNINLISNIIISFLLGMILICAILIVIFIFDDKIKTPDDVQKRLGLNVLGAIPEIE
ncbi:MAG: hypothetical protein IJW54_02305 [Clostridia bacterium]|nr:hypothetical protein [Clostridia bacterium]